MHVYINVYISLVHSARVVPMKVSATPDILKTTFCWRLEENVRARIHHLDVEVLQGGTPQARTLQVSPSEQMTTFDGLGSAQEHTVRVVAVYNDGVRAASEAIRFTTPGML